MIFLKKYLAHTEDSGWAIIIRGNGIVFLALVFILPLYLVYLLPYQLFPSRRVAAWLIRVYSIQWGCSFSGETDHCIKTRCAPESFTVYFLHFYLLSEGKWPEKRVHQFDHLEGKSRKKEDLFKPDSLSKRFSNFREAPWKPIRRQMA